MMYTGSFQNVTTNKFKCYGKYDKIYKSGIALCVIIKDP